MQNVMHHERQASPCTLFHTLFDMETACHDLPHSITSTELAVYPFMMLVRERLHHATAAPGPVLLRVTLRGHCYHDGPHVMDQLRVGDGLQLVREPENDFDEHAVAVHWKGAHLGYLPREHNRVVASSQGRAVDGCKSTARRHELPHRHRGHWQYQVGENRRAGWRGTDTIDRANCRFCHGTASCWAADLGRKVLPGGRGLRKLDLQL